MSASHAPRCAAIIGPYQTGKTTLLEALLFASGRLARQGNTKDGSSVGDASPEARQRQMSTQLNVGTCEYLGDRWSFIDCPGSVEFSQDTHDALMAADAAIVVCEADVERAAILAPLFRFLDDHDMPHLVFINKADQLEQTRVRDVLSALQGVSARPLVLRQVPIREGEHVIGCVDLVSERAYRYKPGEASEIVQLPAEIEARESEARQELLESLADFDDALLEQLLEDAVPPSEEIYKHLAENLAEDRIVPVFMGAAEQSAGVRRLLKALRHETPEPATTAARLGVEAIGTAATVFKTFHLPHSGKQSLVRVWSGNVAEGMLLNGSRVAGVARPNGQDQEKLQALGAGEVGALARMEEVHTGALLTEDGAADTRMPGWPEPLAPLYAFAIEPENRQDEVKLSGALTRIIEEDPSFAMEHNPDTRDFLLWGQGEIHLRVALDRLENRNKLPVTTRAPQVAYRESIRGSVSQHARHKKQSGGHGQFGDVHIDIKPLPRGGGFAFDETIHGGAVPRQYIPAVEKGVRDYLRCGPLGFPVVDVAVTLTDGQYHSVDSSDQAFQAAARAAMNEGMPGCRPVLLEPIHAVNVCTPTVHASKVHGLIGGRRGQILGFDAREGWTGWEEVHAHIPESELYDFIVELRSLTQGVGTFTHAFDHLQELTGRVADEVVASRAQQLGRG